MNGALLIDKHAGTSSFGVIEILKETAMKKLGCKHRQLPQELQKMGHGGTLDPFATGLLVVCIGRGVKLSRYFLGSVKTYEAVIHFGETTIPGDPTADISERSEHVPSSRDEIQAMADRFSAQQYLQTPPMHSAKKKDGRPLYELARQGIEIEREPKLCNLYNFRIESYAKPDARISVGCSSGTYIRTLAQDFARLLGSVAMLTELRRTRSGHFEITRAMTTEAVDHEIQNGTSWDSLPCFVPFDRLLDGYARAVATPDEATALLQGRQQVLFPLLGRTEGAPVTEHDDAVAIYTGSRLLAVARRENGAWGIERVFPPRD